MNSAPKITDSQPVAWALILPGGAQAGITYNPEHAALWTYGTPGYGVVPLYMPKARNRFYNWT